ncbi:SDR family NAD(P)-dependent oxidoreductase [Novosphingobium mangrovi (ex Huang et al. 2023)]|uniref:SDR family NAD(P)-dependent oxidoreductase n=1 Tax=Novosphingobium mangrovi (ex Huang et al. 2023) TaxID=2976432 RepID=A0ABT2I0I2_9SPHN|nr:SDR family NAD(P)-dependent oxidoreductase [Novosphingobium mangrovi (ex Huang et al. 2023)]MCT2398312.1 SDR family NAD(P)-dependent oxidoreductase [Novosphingobium mangrovi (ex Huang et al. 2023)]
MPTPEMRFDGRVAVVTGAGRGLGRAYALLLASRGCKVIVNDLGGAINGDRPDTSVAQTVVDEIVAAGGEAIANGDSVATPEGGKAIIQSAFDTWGRIDSLIHNAGNVRYGTIREISYDDFKSVVDVHLMGAFHVVQAAFGPMCDANFGRIVLTSSIGGVYGNNRCVNYGMSKAGMIGLNSVAALEGEEFNVKSNVIVPSAVTRMAEGIDISQYPPMDPELVAPVVAWLAHEACPVSGEMIASIAGRISRMFIAETKGVYRPSWTIEDVAAACEGFHDKGADNPQVLDFGLHGHVDHIGYSFAMAREGR